MFFMKILHENLNDINSIMQELTTPLHLAAKNGHMDALEHQTYWAIRFDKQPNLKKIEGALQQIADSGKSARACNTLAEFAHAQSKGGQDVAKSKEAAKYYQTSSEMGCIIGKHWSGVFC